MRQNALGYPTPLDCEPQRRCITVLVVSSRPLFLEGFHEFVQQHEAIRIVGSVTELSSVPYRVKAMRTDILLLDIPALNANALEVLQKVHLRSPGTKGLISSVLVDEDLIAEALQWGIRGFLVNTGRWETYVKAIRAIHAGDVWISRQTLACILGNLLQNRGYTQDSSLLNSIEPLTTREREIVHWVAKGMTNKEVAMQLGISDKTIKTHLDHIFDKLKINRRMQLLSHPLHEGAESFPGRQEPRNGGGGVA